jgi:hypothetical protein
MQVQMMNRLPAIIPCIDHHTVSLIEPLRSRQIGRGSHQMTQQRLMLGKRLRLRRDMLFGNDQQMRRSLRIDIRETDAPLIFIDTVGRNRTFNNLAEQTVTRHKPFHLVKYLGCSPEAHGLYAAANAARVDTDG